MAEKDFVRASVVDIRRPGGPLPRQAVVDASVLYFVFYSNFTALQQAGGSPPAFYQSREYPHWLKTALQAGTRFYSCAPTFGELLRLAEYAELEALSVTNPGWVSGTRFTPAACKQARYAGTPADLGLIRQRANNDLQSARKVVTLLPRWADAGDEHDAALKEWLASAGDFGDAALVANAKYAQVPHVFADDIDLLTFDGITVYTANQRAIAAASAAGKLL